jgi:TorA maturation chaperone TorD
MTVAAPLKFLPPEEAARANLYGLVARLFYAAPDAHLISELLRAPPIAGDGPLAGAWQAVVDGCRDAFPVTLENEHTELFVGTGKSEVTPYLSHYVLRFSNDNPLVELRQQLAVWKIGRREQVPEYEDHVSGICEAMRMAIAVQQRSPEEQKRFFDRFVYRGATAFCDAITASSKANFYRSVAQFTRAFLDIEKTAFEMVD